MRVFLAPISTRPIDSKTVTWNGNLEAAEFLEKKTERSRERSPRTRRNAVAYMICRQPSYFSRRRVYPAESCALSTRFAPKASARKPRAVAQTFWSLGTYAKQQLEIKYFFGAPSRTRVERAPIHVEVLQKI